MHLLTNTDDAGGRGFASSSSHAKLQISRDFSVLEAALAQLTCSCVCVCVSDVAALMN